MNNKYEYYKSLPYVREYPDGVLEVKKHYDFDNMSSLGFNIRWDPEWSIKHPNFRHLASLEDKFIGHGNTPELAVKNLLTFNNIYLNVEFGFNNVFIKAGLYDKNNNFIFDITPKRFAILSDKNWSFLVETSMLTDNIRINKFKFYPF